MHTLGFKGKADGKGMLRRPQKKKKQTVASWHIYEKHEHMRETGDGDAEGWREKGDTAAMLTNASWPQCLMNIWTRVCIVMWWLMLLLLLCAQHACAAFLHPECREQQRRRRRSRRQLVPLLLRA
jgi:hypothetical protein